MSQHKKHDGAAASTKDSTKDSNKDSIFRQVALQRLSSPDELDMLLQVTTVKGWLALGGMGILISSALVWSVLGTLPAKLAVQQCILIKRGDVNVVATASSGRLVDLAVDVGDNVTRGQIIGRIDQFELLQKIKANEARLKELQMQYAQSVALAQKGSALRDVTLAQQSRSLSAQHAAASQKVRLIRERIESQKSLVEQGLITRQTLIASQLELSSSELEVETANTQLKQLDVTRLEGKKQSENEVTLLGNQLDEAKRNLELMQREAKSAIQIVSPYSGRVVELKASEGQLVERGSSLLSVQAVAANANEIEAYIYLPAADGKKIKPDMKVEISPSTARREEFGFLPALVSHVADFPSSDQGLMRVFGNEKLVQQLSGSLPPIQILASLKPASANRSGFQWSTRSGPPFAIQSGTLCTASITLSEQRPIAMVIPILKKNLGLD